LKPLAHILFALLVAALQSAFLRWAGGGSFSLMLPMACVVYLAIHAGNVDGSFGAAGIGWVVDVFTGTTLGLITFLAVLAFLLVRGVNAAIDVRGRWGFAVLTTLTVLFTSLGALFLMRLAAPDDVAPGIRVVPRMLVEAVCTGALSPFVHAGMKRVDGFFRREDPGLLR
jgi:rod shape-determining protein MreD